MSINVYRPILLFQVDELSQQINCYEQELEAKNKQSEAKDLQIRTLKDECDRIAINSADKVNDMMKQMRIMESKIQEVSDSDNSTSCY